MPLRDSGETGLWRGHQLVELAEQFVHHRFHFGAYDGQSQHRLDNLTELCNQRAKSIADVFLLRRWKFGQEGFKSTQLGGDVLQFREGCCGSWPRR